MFKSIVLALTIFVSSCAYLTTPRDVQDSAAYAIGQVTAMRNTCTSLGETQKLRVEDTIACLEFTDEARKWVEVAKNSPDLKSKEFALERALEILTFLEEVLKEIK